MTAAKGSSGKTAAKGKPAKAATARPSRPAAAKTNTAARAAPTGASRAGASKSSVAKPTASKSVPARSTPPAKPVAAKAVPPKAPVPAVVSAKPAPAAIAKTGVAKSTTVKTPAKSSGSGRKGRSDSGSEANLHKRVDSERIALHIAAFEKSGGRVEKLGVTRVLQKVSEVAAAAPAQAAKTGSRRR